MPTPIICDMSTASDTEEERFAEYQRLFAQTLVGRERAAEGIRFRFRAEPGVESWVRDLAAREKACCAFHTYTVEVSGEEVWWDCSVPDDDIARAVMEEFYALPDLLAESPGAGVDQLSERFARHGLGIVSNPATPAEPTTRRPA